MFFLTKAFKLSYPEIKQESSARKMKNSKFKTFAPKHALMTDIEKRAKFCDSR